MNRVPNEVIARMFVIEMDFKIIQNACQALGRRCKPIITEALLLKFSIMPRKHENPGKLFQGAWLLAHAIDIRDPRQIKKVDHALLLQLATSEARSLEFASALTRSVRQIQPELSWSIIAITELSMRLSIDDVDETFIQGAWIAKTFYGVGWQSIAEGDTAAFKDIVRFANQPQSFEFMRALLHASPWGGEEYNGGVQHVMGFYDLLTIPALMSNIQMFVVGEPSLMPGTQQPEINAQTLIFNQRALGSVYLNVLNAPTWPNYDKGGVLLARTSILDLIQDWHARNEFPLNVECLVNDRPLYHSWVSYREQLED